MAVGPISPKSTLKSSIALGLATVVVSTYSNKNVSVLNDYLMYCSKQVSLSQAQFSS
jgi:Na+-translocating ferredoxin:NAD+ oxidoreductase RnfE subunit